MIDTNLLVLLVVGRTSVDLVARHRRTTAYDAAAFDLLDRYLLAGFNALVTTPHILAETSNLASACTEPARSRIMRTLAAFIRSAEEIAREARVVVESDPFERLGLTDAAIMALVGEVEILTDDLPLYLAASRSGVGVTNFTHLRAAHFD